ncbi:hypothetical protein LCGC14_1614590 [marine sediment metagenome]|uniref:HNH nuclease domain-containing protein n=1 Tax=marine sediment metagenome TaxID=412755 RepID=A0A0F9KN01_9ZZZZ
MEVFKEIKGFNDYAVSTQGRVRRLTKGPGARAGRILKPLGNGKGYLKVHLTTGGKQVTRHVHRFVATAFLWPRPGLEVNHKNGDKADNRLVNLELVTRSENHLHAYRTGLRAPSAAMGQVGEQNHKAKLCEDSVREIRALRASGMTHREIGDRMGVARASITDVLNGKNWKHVN